MRTPARVGERSCGGDATGERFCRGDATSGGIGNSRGWTREGEREERRTRREEVAARGEPGAAVEGGKQTRGEDGAENREVSRRSSPRRRRRDVMRRSRALVICDARDDAAAACCARDSYERLVFIICIKMANDALSLIGQLGVPLRAHRRSARRLSSLRRYDAPVSGRYPRARRVRNDGGNDVGGSRGASRRSRAREPRAARVSRARAVRAPVVRPPARVSSTRVGASSSGGAPAPPSAPAPGFTEPYSFFDLASAEFPDDWRSPTARVVHRDSPLDIALMAWFSRKIATAIDAPVPPTSPTTSSSPCVSSRCAGATSTASATSPSASCVR